MFSLPPKKVSLTEIQFNRSYQRAGKKKKGRHNIFPQNFSQAFSKKSKITPYHQTFKASLKLQGKLQIFLSFF